MKDKIITSVSICLAVAAIILDIVVFRMKTGSPEASRVRIMGETVSEETDILTDASGTHGYVHGVWGFGRNLSERSNILEQERDICEESEIGEVTVKNPDVYSDRGSFLNTKYQNKFRQTKPENRSDSTFSESEDGETYKKAT